MNSIPLFINIFLTFYIFFTILNRYLKIKYGFLWLHDQSLRAIHINLNFICLYLWYLLNPPHFIWNFLISRILSQTFFISYRGTNIYSLKLKIIWILPANEKIMEFYVKKIYLKLTAQNFTNIIEFFFANRLDIT